MILNELKRACSRLSVKILILTLVLFGIIKSYQLYSFKYSFLETYLKGYIFTSFNYFMLFDNSTTTNFFVLIIPIISTLGYSDSYYEDLRSKFIINICARKKKYKYLLSKYFSNFIVGGVILTIPLLLSYLITILKYPSIQPNIIFGNGAIGLGDAFSKLYYTNTNIYILIWILIYFLYGGIFSSISLSFSIFLKNKFLIIITPFILYMLVEVLAEIMNHKEFSPFYFLYSFNNANLKIIFMEFLAIFIVTLSAYIIGGLKSELY